MSTAIIVIHIVVCIALILIVLLQTGKGASLGAAFGGSTQTVFGATGAAGFFEKLTTAVAVIFMVTSLSLTYISARSGGRSVMKAPAAEEKKATPDLPEDTLPDKDQPASSSTMPLTPFPSGGEGVE
jgi:preprotein translocase subunit SecG